MDLTTRRGFLKAAAVTTVAAVTTGSGAAVVMKEMGAAHSTTAPIVAVSGEVVRSVTPIQNTLPVTAPAQVVSVSNPANTQMANDFASSLAENVRLQSDLSAAQQRIAELESALNTTSEANSSLQTDRDNLANERNNLANDRDNLANDLTGAMERIGILSGLVAMVDQLDEIDISGVVSRGVQGIGETIAEVVDDIPTVNESLVAGRNALSQFESEIPLIDGARIWLLMHITRIAALFANIERMVAIAADNAGPVVQLIGEWVENVLRWLPFNLGEKTGNLVSSIADLLDATPDTFSKTNERVLRPLELWLGSADTPDMPLIDNVVKPVRDGALASAENILNKASTLRTSHQARLADPINLALDQRARIQDSIRAYREMHAL